jgi:hypothetical protein
LFGQAGREVCSGANGEVPLRSGQIAISAAPDVTVVANEVLLVPFDAEAREHLPANVVEAPAEACGSGGARRACRDAWRQRSGAGHQGHAADHHSYILLQDKEAMSEAVANMRWLIAAGIRDFQAMLVESGGAVLG